VANYRKMLGGIYRAVTHPRASLRQISRILAKNNPSMAKALLKIDLAFEGREIERKLTLGEISLIDGDLISSVRRLREVVAIQPTVSTMYQLGVDIARAEFTDDEYEKAICVTVEDEMLREMMISLIHSPKIYHPSRFWLYFMLYNAFQIDTHGLINFKRTANNNYFTWTGDIHVEEQTYALERLSDNSEKLNVISVKPLEFSQERWDKYTRFLVALYRYTKACDRCSILQKIEEPELGNPIHLSIDGRRISQDLCHTVIELNAILPHIGKASDEAFTVYELGAGHGRIGRALISLFPNARYVVIDIPPALYVSQWYLSSLFEKESVFTFRNFFRYEQIAQEFESSRLAFLLPHQAATLPSKSSDLFINVCSIQEMTRAHVNLWFSEINRLCKGQFYTKQYIEHMNHVDGFSLNKADYPVGENWSVNFDRQCEAFPSLFEAQYRIG
jgi:putative sugar O-methyltransferase